MSKLIFKPDDFNFCYPGDMMAESMAEAAQRRFDAWLSEQKIVHTINSWENAPSFTVRWGEYLNGTNFILIEIDKKELFHCKHPWENIKCVNYEWVCECGKKMKPASFMEASE